MDGSGGRCENLIGNRPTRGVSSAPGGGTRHGAGGRRFGVSAPLPPLPPVLGDGWGAQPAGGSMVDVLVEDHHQLRVLCVELADLGGPAYRRQRVADVLSAVLSRHLSAEEQYLYPTVRAVLPGGGPLADHEIAADQAMLRTLRRLRAGRPGDDAFEQAVHAIHAEVGRHVAESSGRIFPRLRV